MRLLHLSGYGVKVRVKNLRTRSDIMITDGRQNGAEGKTETFRPRRIPYDSIIIDGHSGYVSLQALHWLSRNKVPVFVLSCDGSLLSSILPPMPVKADLRAAQFRACTDPDRKFAVARSLVQAKVARSLQVLDWLAESYDISREIRLCRKETFGLNGAANVGELRSAEGRVATKYWLAFRKVIPECFDFQGRMTTSHQNNASDPVNVALNYAYGVLEGECRRAINAVGLEPSVGFLHELSNYQTKQSLVYDLQEPFRWIADISVLKGFESGTLDLPDFYFTGDDYLYRVEFEAKRRLIDQMRKQFNSGVRYNGRSLHWDTVIEQKTTELGRFLVGSSHEVDFTQPEPVLERADNRVLRERILSLTHAEARLRGISKSTLHYLRKNAISQRPFRVNEPVRTKLTLFSRSNETEPHVILSKHKEKN